MVKKKVISCKSIHESKGFLEEFYPGCSSIGKIAR